MKHIYIYLAPAYFVFLLRNYCLPHTPLSFKTMPSVFYIKKLFLLGSLVLLVFLVTYIPFYDHIGQVKKKSTSSNLSV